MKHKILVTIEAGNVQITFPISTDSELKTRIIADAMRYAQRAGISIPVPDKPGLGAYIIEVSRIYTEE